MLGRSEEGQGEPASTWMLVSAQAKRGGAAEAPSLVKRIRKDVGGFVAYLLSWWRH